MPRIDCSGPHAAGSVFSCLRKSSSVNSFLRSLRSSSLASSSSTCASAFSMSDMTSPMPRIRWAMRSGWKRSNWSSFSPVDAKRIGLPVTALTRQRGAAAGVAVELAHDHAVELDGVGELLGDVDRVLAGHRVDDEQDRVRLDRACGCRTSSSISASSTCRRPEVSTMSTSLPSRLGAVQRPARDVDRVAVGALLVDVGADLRADLDELVDGGGAVDVAGRQRDRRAVLALAASARAWPPRSSCPSPAGRRARSPSAGAARRSPRARRRPSARRAPR